MKEEDLEEISGGSAINKVLNFAHYPVNHTVDFINSHISDTSGGRQSKNFVRVTGDLANTAIDIYLWVGLVYAGYKGFKTPYNTAIQKGWISKCN